MILENIIHYLRNDVIGVSSVNAARSLEPAAFDLEVAYVLFGVRSHEHI